jgi:predicted metal-binding membrane protein
MLPSLIPMLQHYRQAVGRSGEPRLGALTALVGVGYFSLWTVIGLVVFPLGAGLAAAEIQEPMLARAVPVASGAIVLMAGALQLTAWKAHRLACCRTISAHSCALPADAGAALLHGLRLGVRCAACCANLMAILLVIGIMDLGAMTLVTAAITAERLLPAGESIARSIGTAFVAAGLLLIAHAIGVA